MDAKEKQEISSVNTAESGEKRTGRTLAGGCTLFWFAVLREPDDLVEFADDENMIPLPEMIAGA